MRPHKRNPYHHSFHGTALAACVSVIAGGVMHAEDLSFNGSGTVRLLAQDWAAYLPNTTTFNGEINDGGRLYWRGSAGDGQYMHFDLTRLSGLTVSSAASVTLQGARTQWGGSVTDSFIASANGSWRAAGGSAIPGATAIGDAINATGNYDENSSVTWGIGQSTFQGYVNNASSFNGLAIIGGASSTMHFWGPINPYLEVTTNASMANVVTVSGGTAWNSGNYSFINGVLSINNSVAGGTSGAGAVTINSLGTVFVNGNSGDNRYWALDSTTINAGGVLVMQGHSHIHNLTLNGGELAGIRPSGGWGGWSFDDATTVTATSTISAQQMNFDNGTFNVSSGATLNVTGSIRSGQIIKEGAGSMVLSGSNASSGGITINGGTLVAARSAQDNGIHTLGTGNITVNNGGTLRSTSQWSTSSEWNGTSVGSVTINNGGTWSIEGVGQTIRNGLFLNGGSITATVSNGDWGALHLKSGVTAGDGITPTTSSIAADTALSGSQTITVNSGSQLNYSGVIHNQHSTSSGITKAGAGTLVLSGANSYSGGTTVSAGTLSITGTSALPGWDSNGMYSVASGTTLAVGNGVDDTSVATMLGTTNFAAGSALGFDTAAGDRTFATAIANTGQGALGVTKLGANILTISGINSYTGTTTVDAGSLKVQSSIGSSSVIVVNGGTLEIAATNVLGTSHNSQFNSPITINAGGTVSNSNGALNRIGNINLNGGTLTANTDEGNYGSFFFGQANNADPTVTVGGSVASTINGTGNIKMWSNVNFNVADATGNANADLVVSASLGNQTPDQGSGAAGITKSGNGTMVLAGANSYSGGTSLNAGTLEISGIGTIGNGSLAVRNGAALNLGATSQTLGGDLNASGTGNGAVGTISNGTLNLNGRNAYLQSGTFTMNLTGGGNSRLWIGGDAGATVELGGTNSSTFSDSNSTIIGHGTTGNAGTVKLLSATALGPNGQNTQVHSGTLDLNGQNGITVSSIMLNNGNLANSNTSSAASYAGTVTFNGTTTPQIGGPGDITLGGQLTSGGFTKVGSGKLTLTVANTYSGGTTINGGTLRLDNTAALGGGGLNMSSGTTLQLRADGDATFAGGDGLAGLGGASITIDVNQLSSGNSNKTLGFAPGGFNTFTTTVNVTGGNGYTLAIGGINEGFNGPLALNANSANLTIGNIGSASAVSSLSVGGNSNTAITGAINSTNGLAKSGNGTLTLDGSSTYTGPTTISGGKLVVDGSISTSITTVESGGTLGGSGTVGSVIVQAGGTVSPGNSPGILNVNGDYSQSGTLAIEINGLTPGTQHDQVNVDRLSGDGTVSLSGNLSLLFGGGSYVDGDLLFILLNDDVDAITGTFSGLAQNDIVTSFGGVDWIISYAANSTGNAFTGGNDVALMAVPEPEAALLGGLGLLALLRRRR